MNEEGYTIIPALPSKHIEQLESMLERTEMNAELARMLSDGVIHPNDYKEYVQEEYERDIEALRYAIAAVKWLNGESES